MAMCDDVASPSIRLKFINVIRQSLGSERSVYPCVIARPSKYVLMVFAMSPATSRRTASLERSIEFGYEIPT
jgi:hypothetical protein